jgi:hypothetical protein
MEQYFKSHPNGIVGAKALYGCDVVEICSIIVNGFVNVKMTHPHDKGKIVILHISQIEIL